MKVVKVKNLLRPDLREFKTYDADDLPMTVADSVAEFEQQLRADGFDKLVVTRNGHIIEEPYLEKVEDGDLITISVKHGFFAAAGWLLGFTMFWGNTMLTTLLAGALMVGAGLLVKTFMGAPKPSNKTDGMDSPSYGFSGTNPTQAGYPVPVVYGYTKTVCPVLASYRSIDPNWVVPPYDYSMWQWVLFAACVGSTNVPITADRVLAGDEVITTLNNYAFAITDGSNSPSAAELTWFQKVYHDRIFNRILVYNYEFTLNTLWDCDSVDMIMEFSSGLFRMNDEGSILTKTVVFEVSYALTGGVRAPKVAAQGTISLTGLPTADVDTITIDTITWTFVVTRTGVGEIEIGADADATADNIITAITADIATVTAARGTGNTVVVTAATAGAAGNSIVFTEVASNLTVDGSGNLGTTTAGSDGAYSTWTCGESRTSACRSVCTVTFPARGKYTVYVRRTTADDPTSDSKQRSIATLISFLEILNIQQTYPGIQTVAIGMKADDNISGQIPTISIIQERTSLTVPDWDNVGTMVVDPSIPAYAAYAAMTDAITGRKISPLDINQTAWEEWAAWTEVVMSSGYKRAQFNMAFDEKGNFGDNCLAYIEEVGRAKIVQYGDTWTVIIDKPKTSSYSFSSGNILKGSFKWEGYEDAEKVDAVEMVYWDKDKMFKKTSVLSKASWYDVLTTQPNVASIELRACNNFDQATREATFRMQKTEMITRHGQLEVGIQAIFCERGDVTDIIHPTNKYGFGGKLVRDCSASTTIYLDQLITLSTASYSGKAKIFLIDPDGVRHELTITGPFDVETQYVTVSTAYTGERFDTFAIGRPNDEKLLYQIVNKKVVPADENKMERIQIEFVEYVDEVFYHASWGSGLVAI